MTVPEPATGRRSGPSPQELAAIIAAVEVAWPRPVVVGADETPPRPWRWSGRWWTAGKPTAADRRRPQGM